MTFPKIISVLEIFSTDSCIITQVQIDAARSQPAAWDRAYNMLKIRLTRKVYQAAVTDLKIILIKRHGSVSKPI